MVNKKRIVDTFIKLTEFDAESFHEKEIGDYLEGILKSLGLRTERDKVGNIYGILASNLPEGEENEAILFSSHMDTVSPGNSKKAIIHEDDTITSDKTTVLGADDISGLTEILELLYVIKENNLNHPDIEVLFSVAEEPYSAGCKEFDFSKIKSKTAYVLDLSGEIGRAAIAAPSIISFEIKVKGKAAHAGFSPEKGIHSIKIASLALSEIEMGFVEEKTSVNVGTITGGTGKNIVPKETILTGEIRSMDDKKAHFQLDKIIDIFEKSALKYNGEIDFTFEEHFRAYNEDKNSKSVKRYLKACEKLGINSELIETFGGSDNNRFQENGINGIVLSCGMYNVHTTDEYTKISDLVKASEILVEMIS